MKNNRCESNDRKMQDHENIKVRRWKMEDQIWGEVRRRKMDIHILGASHGHLSDSAIPC